ncbi:two-partner secretion domain-containing protein, partial [Almyronema epifaneia]
ANLFLLNPAGILFGPNASLATGGSFISTTADSISFDDGTEFSASQTTGTPLLTLSSPVGLQLGSNAGTIQVEGPPLTGLFIPRTPTLSLPAGKTLALVGSQIDINSATLMASDGQIELWAIQEAEVVFDNSLTNWRLDSPTATAIWGTVSLQQSSLVDASGANGGSINVRGRGLTLQGGSNIQSRTSTGQGQGITVNTTEFIELLGNADATPSGFDGISTSVGNVLGLIVFPGPPATGQAGDVTIQTQRLRMTNGAWLSSLTAGNNSGTGNVMVRATDIDMMGYETLPGFTSTSIASLIVTGNNNQSGNVTVDAQRVRLLEGSRISSSVVAGNGQAGEVSVTASESLEIRGSTSSGGFITGSLSGLSSAILASLEAGTTGQGGQISINAGLLTLAEGGAITSELAGSKIDPFMNFLLGARGTAGNIDIQAREVEISDPIIDGFSQTLTGITASIGEGATGIGGNINLTADNLRIFNGGQITSSSQGNGPAGNVNLTASTIDVQGRSQ